MITLVLASSYRCFEDWCREREINPKSPLVKYVWQIEDVRGLGQRVKVVVDDSFYWRWELGKSSLLAAAWYVEDRNNQIYPEDQGPTSR